MLRLLICTSLLVALSSASSCGDSTIPFSLEVLPNGQPVLGCARPTCFGWDASGQPVASTAHFNYINDRPDGFIRSLRESIPAFGPEDPRYHSAQTASCERSYTSSTCPRQDQWVGGIAPLLDVVATPTFLQCCSYEPLQQSEERGVSTLDVGKIAVGGEVLNHGKVFGFDYISDIAKVVNEDDSIQYKVTLRRMPCAGVNETAAHKLGAASNIIKRNGIDVTEASPPFQASTAVMNYALPNTAQPASLNDIFNVNPANTYALPPQQPQPVLQPPTQFNPPPFQAPMQVGSFAAAPQYPSGAGCCSQFCFTGDMTVQLIDRTTKRMDQLKKTDWVLGVADNDLEYMPVEFWLHRVPEQEAEFNVFETEDGKTIKLTDKHYIYKGDCTRLSTGPVYPHWLPKDAVTADQVHAGDCLFTLGADRQMQEVRVVRTDRVKQTGIYAPMTSNGRIIVNDVYASCHNIMQEHTTGHAVFEYVVMINNVYDAIFGSDPEEVVETPTGLSTILAMADLVMPKSLLVV